MLHDFSTPLFSRPAERRSKTGAKGARTYIYPAPEAPSATPGPAPRSPGGPAEATRAALADPRVAGGRFDVHLDSPRVIFRVIAFFINRRARLSRRATRAQGLFCRPP